ncbi:MAG: DinB family protein [Fluviicola sp.]|nr:DinB family protein [Fluviicola sp.]
MTRKNQLMAQLAAEAKTTRTFLELVPMDQADFKAHEKSMRLMDIVLHVVELPLWAEMAVTTDELDFAKEPYNPKQFETRETMITYFDECVDKGMQALDQANDAVFDENWVLRNGESIYMSSTKEEVARVAHNQTVHHRAQLGVYFRLLDIPVPPSYGPTADFPDFV